MRRVGGASAFLILIILAVTAVAFLVTATEPSVGVSLIAGVVLGVVAALSYLAIMSSRGTGGAAQWSSGFSTYEVQDAIQQHHQKYSQVAAVDASELQRVIAIASIERAGGVAVELTAVEIRDDGGVALLVAHTRPPTGQIGHMVEVSVSDDRATTYAASGQASGGAYATATRFEVRFAPSPPSDATTLNVRIDAFLNPFPGQGKDRMTGPWEFAADLGEAHNRT